VCFCKELYQGYFKKCHWLFAVICGFSLMVHWPILGHRPYNISTNILLVEGEIFAIIAGFIQ
jgi:hypothetical protein